jgi:prepilin-type N-terminal cleavage/methylation domain-containing protein
MKRYARNAGSDSGFTLLEVLLAAAILAMAASTFVVIYVHSVKQAGYSRELGYASSTARNAIEETFAQIAPPKAEGELPARPNLYMKLETTPAGEDLLADTISVRISDKTDGSDVIVLETKRAVYVQPEEPEVNGVAEPETDADAAPEAMGDTQ